jgi:16S rRNA (cytosine1402-N4)-methyltransferase
VKVFMKNGSFGEEEADEIYGTRKGSPFRLVARKPILPSGEEIRKNPRSRSAKLRVCELK